ncbi:MAG: hypothetical protein U1E65_07615 [Myxococcota bacterium]
MVKSDDGRLQLFIPSGALTTPVSIRIEVDSDPANAISDLAPTYRLSPEHVIFVAPVELAFIAEPTADPLELLSVDLPSGPDHPYPLVTGTSTSLRIKAFGYGCSPAGGQVCYGSYCSPYCANPATPGLDDGVCYPSCLADINCSYLWTCRLDTSDNCRLSEGACTSGACGAPLSDLGPEYLKERGPKAGEPGFLAPDQRRPYPCLGHLFTARKAVQR